MSHPNLCAALFCVFFEACGPSPNATLAAAPTSFSSAQILAEVAALPETGAGSFAAIVAQVGTMRVTDYYQSLTRLVPAQGLAIDGFLFRDFRAALDAQRGSYAALDARFATVKEWWQAIGYQPSALSVEALTVALKGLTKAAASAPAEHAEIGLVSACGNVAPGALASESGLIRPAPYDYDMQTGSNPTPPSIKVTRTFDPAILDLGLTGFGPANFQPFTGLATTATPWEKLNHAYDSSWHGQEQILSGPTDMRNAQGTQALQNYFDRRCPQ